MNKSTFKALKRAIKFRGSNENELKQIKRSTPNPFTLEKINLLLGHIDDVSFSDISSKFLDVENSLQYKDQLVITYLTFLGKLMNNELAKHMFFSPHTFTIFHWLNLYKKIVFSVVTLMYNKKFNDEIWSKLDDTIDRLNEGYADSVRKFLTDIKVLSIPNSQPLEIETNYTTILSMGVDHFGPFYWRMIHFMAEAISIRKSTDFAKLLWKDFMQYSFYRTLLCPICMSHYQGVIKNFENELSSISTNYPKLWFKIHNEVNKKLNKSLYSEEDFEKDRSIMQNLLKS